MHYFSALFSKELIPTSLADSQHNEYDKHQLLWIQY
jgi:hypothetical protein